MCERKCWTSQEDQRLRQIMQQNDQASVEKRLKWDEVALRISQGCGHPRRKGKQCRQRWFSQLHPSINKQAAWSLVEQNKLYRLQGEWGNKWARIARQLPGHSDNNIKNYFYSTLRKTLRSVNKFLTCHKHQLRYKNIKAFQSNTLSKILTVSQNKAERKISVGKQDAVELARGIKQLLIQIEMSPKNKGENCSQNQMALIIDKIQDFNRCCKRKKTKKRNLERSQLQNSNNEDEILSQKLLLSDPNQIMQEQKSQDLQLSRQNLIIEFQQKPLQEKQALPEKETQVKMEKLIKDLQIELHGSRQPIIPILKFRESEPNMTSQQTFQKGLEQLNASITKSQKQQQKTELSIFPFIPIFQSEYEFGYPSSAFLPTTSYFARSGEQMQEMNLQRSFNYQNFPLNWSQDLSTSISLNKSFTFSKQADPVSIISPIIIAQKHENQLEKNKQ